MKRASGLLLAAVVLVAGSAVAEDHVITANANLTFTPDFLEIAVGDTVTWTNAGGFHNVNAPGFFRCADGCDGEGGNGDPNSGAWSFTRTFDSEAEIDYFCEPHVGLGMVGTVVVGGGNVPIDLSISGACPGSITISISGLAPNASVALLSSPSEGSGQLLGGPCAGTETGLSNPSFITLVPADAQGEVNLTRTVPGGACGLFLQAVDTSCNISTVGQIP